MADADADGIRDSADAQVFEQVSEDLDQDGVKDEVYLLDSDQDGVPNYMDLDSDNDGIVDLQEVELTGADTRRVVQLAGVDNNANGIVDSVESALNANVSQALLRDTDNDGSDDHLDLDSDEDSVSDVREAKLGYLDPDEDKRISAQQFVDINQNGLHDTLDPMASGR